VVALGEIFIKICGEDADLLQIEQNYRTVYSKDLSRFYCCWSREITIKISFFLTDFLMV
jgi:hypothetical protein